MCSCTRSTGCLSRDLETLGRFELQGCPCWFCRPAPPARRNECHEGRSPQPGPAGITRQGRASKLPDRPAETLGLEPRRPEGPPPFQGGTGRPARLRLPCSCLARRDEVPTPQACACPRFQGEVHRRVQSLQTAGGSASTATPPAAPSCQPGVAMTERKTRESNPLRGLSVPENRVAPQAHIFQSGGPGSRTRTGG